MRAFSGWPCLHSEFLRGLRLHGKETGSLFLHFEARSLWRNDFASLFRKLTNPKKVVPTSSTENRGLLGLIL